jgi:hypothetical protein|tara:strand:+ start:796 stop:1023 length:228 start_codon:yes stop_codon:yes gene_type:complete
MHRSVIPALVNAHRSNSKRKRAPMAKVEERVKELLAKHPNLTQEEALKIVTDKNARKKNKRAEKSEKRSADKPKT